MPFFFSSNAKALDVIASIDEEIFWLWRHDGNSNKGENDGGDDTKNAYFPVWQNAEEDR